MGVSNQKPADDLNWDDLLGGLEGQEEDAESPTAEKEPRSPAKAEPAKETRQVVAPPKSAAPKKKRAGSGMSLAQKIILGILGLVVLVVVVGVGALISTTLSNTPVAPPPDTAATGEVQVIVPNTPAANTPTLPPTAAVHTPTPTMPPTPTPIVPPGVFTEYDTQIRSDPDNIELRLLRGNQYLEIKVYGGAWADFEYARTLDGTRAEVYAGLGEALYNLRRWSEAETAFNTAISFNQNLAQAHFGLALLYYYAGRYQEAAAEFDWAAEADPEMLKAEAWLAITTARLGNFEEAANAITRTLILSPEVKLPEEPILYVARSWVRRLQTPPDLDGAQIDLLHAAELTPYASDILNAQARFLVDFRPERVAQAEQLAQYAINWAKDDLEKAHGLHTLGRVYLAQGRREEARRTLSDAATLATSDGRIVLAELSADLDVAFAP